MGLIGDIYYAFRGDGARLQKDAQVEGAKAGSTLGKSMVANLKAQWSGANIGKGFVQGLGLAGGLGAVTLISGAVSKFTDVLGESVQQALADEESQNRLRASLKANVPAAIAFAHSPPQFLSPFMRWMFRKPMNPRAASIRMPMPAPKYPP